jgi:hypothetical protein
MSSTDRISIIVNDSSDASVGPTCLRRPDYRRRQNSGKSK